MSQCEGLSQWEACVSSNLPHLTKPQARVLALWSFGVAMLRCCGRRSVATFLGLLLERKVDAVEQQLYEWCINVMHKSGTHRRTVVVSTCFVPLLQWIVRLWSGNQIALAIDATTLRDNLTILSINVVYRGCGIPVAWTILRGNTKGAWQPFWEEMVAQLKPAIPADWEVIVLTDRGLYARWLYRAIKANGWHPYMRLNQKAKFRPQGQKEFVWLNTLVAEVGQQYRGAGTAFKSDDRRVHGTLIAWWGEGYDEPWFILTDLDPACCDATWYGLRSWCEAGFRCCKRGMWQWQQTQMYQPDRAERFWLVLALAQLWMVSIGSDVELGPDAQVPELPDLRGWLGYRAGRGRPIRLVRLGWMWLIVTLIRQEPLPCPQRLLPDPWPAIADPSEPRPTPATPLGYAFM